MNAQLTIDECKLMWVVGALQRLATLGMIGPDIPLKLSGSAVDDYLYIDEHRKFCLNLILRLQVFSLLLSIVNVTQKFKILMIPNL